MNGRIIMQEPEVLKSCFGGGFWNFKHVVCSFLSQFVYSSMNFEYVLKKCTYSMQRPHEVLGETLTCVTF